MKRKYSSKSKKSYKKRRTYKKKSYGARSRVLRSVLRIAETKFSALNISNAAGIQPLLNNVGTNTGSGAGLVLYGNLLRTNRGDSQITRNGDTIYARYLGLKLYVNNMPGYQNVIYRIMVVSTPPDQVNAINPTDFWQGISTNKIIDYVNSDKYKVVYTKMLRISSDASIESGASTQITQKVVNISLKLNRKLMYQTDVSGASAIPKYQKNCLSLIIVPMYLESTPGTETVGQVTVSGKFYFKDF